MQVAEYITVKNALGKPRAYLSPDDGVKDCFIDRRVNGEAKLDFLLPLQSEKWAELTPECRIIADGREFTILRPSAIDVVRSQDGKTWGKVMAEESWALLDKQDVTVSNDPQTPEPADLQVVILSGGVAAGGYPQGSAGSALTYLLQGQTEWTLDTVDVDGAHDLETEKLSLLQNVKKVQELWGGLLVWEYVLDAAGNVTQRKIHLRDEAKWQNYNGFQVRYAKNLKSITKTQNNDIVTKLYPFGQDDLDIASVNGGKKYLTNSSYTQAEYVGYFINQEIDDPQTLKDKATEALAKTCKPRFAYRVGLVDTTTLPEWSHEKYSLGDIVDVVDPDIGTAKARLQRHKYNVFQPWVCELEIGEPEERLAAQLASSFNAADFVKESLRPNPSVSNLLKSFVNTAATTINGAKGNYTMIDGVSTWWDVDENGDRTGKIVRISPQGIGISKDAGQTFKQAMTGSGILASAVICNALYALSSGDGFTKLIDDGLHVYDEDGTERVHVGRWISELAERFGVKIVAADGQTTLLDDRGLPQLWEVSKEDNVDASNPLVLDVYIPPEAKTIKKARLKLRLKAFRAYEKSASAGGDHAHLMFSNFGTDWDGDLIYIFDTDSAGDHSHTANSAGSHKHALYDHNHIDGGGQATSYSSSGIENGGVHTHSTNSRGSHTHGAPVPKIITFEARRSSSGSWGNIGLPGESRSSDYWTWGSSGDHTHPLDFGIYTNTTATGVTIKINGVNRTASLGGPFNSDKTGLDLSPYLIPGDNVIELGSTRLGRISASLHLQSYWEVV